MSDWSLYLADKVMEFVAAEFTSIRLAALEEGASEAYEWLGGDSSQVLAPGCAAAIRALAGKG